MTDIEGVTGVTTFPQAENSDLGREMLMNDLKAVLAGIKEAGGEATVPDYNLPLLNISSKGEKQLDSVRIYRLGSIWE
jgi:hypothetical protein